MVRNTDRDRQSTQDTLSQTEESELRIVDVRDLLGPEQRIGLKLDDRVYTLRITRSDKLILTR